jgi:hypothetical protein
MNHEVSGNKVKECCGNEVVNDTHDNVLKESIDLETTLVRVEDREKDNDTRISSSRVVVVSEAPSI